MEMYLALQKHVKEGGAAMYLLLGPSHIPDPRTARGLGYSPWPAPGSSNQRAPWKGLGKMGKELEARHGFPQPRALTARPTLSCLAFLPEAAEVRGLHDAGVPEKGEDRDEPVPPALPPSHEDHPPVRSLSLDGRGGGNKVGAGPAVSAPP